MKRNNNVGGLTFWQMNKLIKDHAYMVANSTKLSRPDLVAEEEIMRFLDRNFEHGIHCFKKYQWLNPYQLLVVDYLGKTAIVSYDKHFMIVTLDVVE